MTFKIDLHGFKHQDVKVKLETWLFEEFNNGNFPVEVITGNSYKMKQLVKEVCEETGTYLSNINTSNQIIIAGKKENLVNAMDLASRLGAKKAIPLPVGGAFHSGLMASAQEELNNVIDEANFEDAVVPIIANTSAEPITEKNLVRNELKNQLQNCVLWSDSIEYMIDQDVDTFYEIGPGSVLSGMIKRINSDLNVKNIGNYDQVLDYVESKS